MAESSGESLNILEDYGEFLNEYESTTRGCFDNTKKVLANIINKSNLIDFDKYIGTHLKKLQSSIDYLTSKITDWDNSFDEQDPIMGQSMQNRFDKDTVSANPPKFSSSVGFRDIPSKHRNNSQIRSKKQSPEQRTTAYSRWTKISGEAGKNLATVDDFYKTNNALNNCHNTIKILFMNWEELTRKFKNTHNEYEIVQDLINENEEHFIDLIENTERFIQDIQDSGFQPLELPLNNKCEMQNYENSNTRRFIKELDSIAGEYYTETLNKKTFAFNSPYNTFSSAKSYDRGNEVKKNLISMKEANLLDRITELQKQIHTKETNSAFKYESIISKLEKNLKLEVQQHSETKYKYKTLIHASMNFQCALKDLQKAVRAKKCNISSYKKIFDERSKQLSNEFLKFRGKHTEKNDYTYRKEMFDSLKSRTAGPSPAGSERKHRVKSELKLAPINLSKAFNEQESSRNKIEIEKLSNELQKLEKQLENNKIKRKEVSRERDKLQEMWTAKEVMITEKDSIILELQKSITLK